MSVYKRFSDIQTVTQIANSTIPENLNFKIFRGRFPHLKVKSDYGTA